MVGIVNVEEKAHKEGRGSIFPHDLGAEAM